MENNIILGENYDFELIGNSSNYESFSFKVRKDGADSGKIIIVKLYGGITLPDGVVLTKQERNKLHSKAIFEYKKGYAF